MSSTWWDAIGSLFFFFSTNELLVSRHQWKFCSFSSLSMSLIELFLFRFSELFIPFCKLSDGDVWHISAGEKDQRDSRMANPTLESRKRNSPKKEEGNVVEESNSPFRLSAQVSRLWAPFENGSHLPIGGVRLFDVCLRRNLKTFLSWRVVCGGFRLQCVVVRHAHLS